MKPGDDLGELLIAALDAQGLRLIDRDIVAVAQKVVSKVENRFLDLATMSPSPRAQAIAGAAEKDPRQVEAILSESVEIVAHKPGVIVAAHRLGHVMANAGIDRSNVASGEGRELVLLLPKDPDASAARLKQRLDSYFGADVGVIITDSVGRAWRLGTVGIALGAAGVPALEDRRGAPDLFGRGLEVTVTGFADAVAAAAALLMGEADEGRPVVVVSGLNWVGEPAPARVIVRPKEEDMFR